MGLCLSLIASGQHKVDWHVLTVLKDSSAYPFQMISPSQNELTVKLPKFALKDYSISRSLKFPTLNKELPILIGKNEANQKLIIIDRNFNLDFSDDVVGVFDDTLTSTSKGNYKKFDGHLQIGGKDISFTFDYTIVKPQQLNLDLGDSLENKVFFAVRPSHYRHTSIKVDNRMFNLVLFSRNVLDFSKKSTFLMVVPDSVDVRKIKSSDKNYNRYVSGDVILLGEQKFSFGGLSVYGDSIALTKLSVGSEAYGSQIGFLAKDFAGTDIGSGRPVNSRDFDGKYILLDFWGTWCAPCIQILDDIKQMHEGLDKNKIQVIGICYDNSKPKAAEFIKRKGITWTQLFDPRANSTICKDFGISEFPSFVLIDPSGKIIMREEGLNGFQRLRENLKNVLK